MIVSRFWQKDARIRDYVFVYRAMFKETYSAIQEVLGLGFDCYSFRRLPARELCQAFGLNRALILILISHFFTLFSIMSWPFLQSLGRVLDLYDLCVHKGMNQVNHLGLNPQELNIGDLILITIIKFPYLHQI